MKRLMLLAVLAVSGCVTEIEPDYCYRVGAVGQPEAWWCEGTAQFPADTLPDDLKGEQHPRDIP